MDVLAFMRKASKNQPPVRKTQSLLSPLPLESPSLPLPLESPSLLLPTETPFDFVPPQVELQPVQTRVPVQSWEKESLFVAKPFSFSFGDKTANSLSFTTDLTMPPASVSKTPSPVKTKSPVPYPVTFGKSSVPLSKTDDIWSFPLATIASTVLLEEKKHTTLPTGPTTTKPRSLQKLSEEAAKNTCYSFDVFRVTPLPKFTK